MKKSFLASALALGVGVALSVCGQASVANASSVAPNDAAASVDWDDAQEPGTLKTLTVDGVECAFRYCPAGTFQMGSPTSESGRWDDETQHRVELTTGFWLLETEVTQALWKSVMGSNPSCFCLTGSGSSKVSGVDTSNFPVDSVSWNDCQDFIAKLNALGVAPDGLQFRLPTEAEWEYACRAGAGTAYFWGDSLNGDNANCNGNHPCGTSTKGQYLARATQVGSYAPNAWGLYDMHGNVLEWCEDLKTDYENVKSAQDPINVTQGSFRVLRGGSWISDAKDCRSAGRISNVPTSRRILFGFRLVLSRAVDAASPVEGADEDEIELAEDDKAASQEPKTDVSAAIRTALSGKNSDAAPKTDALDENADAAPKTDASGANSDAAWDVATKAGARKTLTVDGVEYAFRYCPAGTFQMGSPTSESGRYADETQHRVELTTGFWLLETEVTQALWKSVMGSNPSWFCSTGGGSSNVSGVDTSNFPVDCVSWNDCQEFIVKLNALGVAPDGLQFRLPTEAEWEYACRAGTSTAYFWGDSLNGDNANCNGNYPCGTSTKGEYLKRTTEAGSYGANGWGLCDMHGNVCEWCADLYTSYVDLKSAQDPINVTLGSRRVLRGSRWNSGAEYCRSAYRLYDDPTNRSNGYGFRLVLGRPSSSSK